MEVKFAAKILSSQNIPDHLQYRSRVASVTSSRAQCSGPIAFYQRVIFS